MCDAQDIFAGLIIRDCQLEIFVRSLIWRRIVALDIEGTVVEDKAGWPLVRLVADVIAFCDRNYHITLSNGCSSFLDKQWF